MQDAGLGQIVFLKKENNKTQKHLGLPCYSTLPDTCFFGSSCHVSIHFTALSCMFLFCFFWQGTLNFWLSSRSIGRASHQLANSLCRVLDGGSDSSRCPGSIRGPSPAGWVFLAMFDVASSQDGQTHTKTHIPFLPQEICPLRKLIFQVPSWCLLLVS